MRQLIIFLVVFFVSSCSASEDTAVAHEGIGDFRALYGIGEFEEIYENADSELKATTSREDFVRLLTAIHTGLGDAQSSEQQGQYVNYVPTGTFVTLTIATQFEHGDGTEQFYFRIDGDEAVLVGYHINSMDLLANQAPTSDGETGAPAGSP